MEITEDKVFAAFGLNKPEEDADGADNTPAEETTAEATGAEQAEETEAADQEQGEETPPEEADGDEGQETGETGNTQTPEQRRANAARRRQQEQQAAIDAAVRQALADRDKEQAAKMEDFFRRASLSNPITGEPIHNMEEFDAWHRAQEQERIQQELKDGKLTEETLNSLIERNPAMQSVRQQAEQARQDAQRKQQAEMEREVERQLAEIRKTDPSIHSVADLMNRPYSRELYAAVQRGNNFEDAFYLATRKQKEEATAQAVQQAAVNKLRNKEHLRTTDIGGKAGATVTPEEEKMYRVFNPKATEDEIQRYQNKYKKH